VGARGATAFAGGVSDGTYGMAAMDLSRGKLTAKKAWFFFDDSYLCLGAGITLVDDPEHSVATDVNQTLLHGAVTSNRSPAPLADGAYAYTANRASWIYHDHVGYVLAPGSHVNLSVGPQTGKWSDIGSGSNQPVTVRVFNLWIDHGHSPRQSTYQYVVLPGASEKETLEFAGSPTIRVLANKDDIQAAWSSRLKVGMIAFRSPGSLATPAGLVAVDHSCLLLIRRIRDGWRISASNPENLPLALTVKIGDEKITMDLPGGNFAGSSVTTTMRMAPVSR
jgi:chondroitin AC lyase